MQEQDKDLAALKALAVAATPGPWSITRANEVGRVSDADDQSFGMVVPHCDVYGERSTDNLAYIAAANPAAILSLLSRIEQQAARIAELEERLSHADEVANASIDAALSYKLDHPSPAVDLSGLTRQQITEAVTLAAGSILHSYKLTTYADSDGEQLPLVDHLSNSAQATIQSGKAEIELIVDAIGDEFERIAPSLLSAPVVREGKMTKERMLDLATESGIDTDTDGDIWGSTNGALLKFAESVEREVLATGKEAQFRDEADLIAWLDKLHECDENGAAYVTKWPAAQRAIAGIRTTSAKGLIEAGALRQYMHSDGSGLVAAYDKTITDRVFAMLTATPSTPSQAWEGELPDFDDTYTGKYLAEQVGNAAYAKTFWPDVEDYTRKAIGAAVAGVRDAALEEAALACEEKAGDFWDQYKGRGKHAPDNPRRADPYCNGLSDGSDECAEAIRSLSSNPVSPKDGEKGGAQNG